jgi:hypothetical protein
VRQEFIDIGVVHEMEFAVAAVVEERFSRNSGNITNVVDFNDGVDGGGGDGCGGGGERPVHTSSSLTLSSSSSSSSSTASSSPLPSQASKIAAAASQAGFNAAHRGTQRRLQVRISYK